MRRTLAPIAAAGLAALLAGASMAAAQSLQSARPEDVGMSTERLGKIGPVFRKEVDEGRLPGAVVMIARRGKVVFQDAFGFQDKASNKPMAKDTIFRAYSMTKPFASVAMMTLVEDGKVELTDPVAKFLPEFKTLQVSAPGTDALGQTTYRLVPAERQPTIQDLLRHTAGLAYGEITANPLVKSAYAKAGLFKPDFDYNTIDLTPEEFVQRLAQAPLAYQPGTVWEYSLAVDVLGRVIEKVTGKRLGEYLDERLFKPLGMAETGFFVAQDKMVRLAQALPTDPATGAPTRLIDVSQAPRNDSGGAGSVTTASDYLRFAQMMLDKGKLDDARILSRTTVALMTSDQLPAAIRQSVQPGEQLMGVQGYTFGLGFMVRKEQGMAAVPGSAGEFMWAGYAGTFFWVDPKEEIVAVMMTQAPGPSRAYYRKLIKQLVYQAVVD